MAVLGGRDSTKVPGIDASYWELIFSKFSAVFKKPGTPPERAINHKINLMLDFVLSPKR